MFTFKYNLYDMLACFLVDSDAELRSMSRYSTERQAGSGNKGAADCIKDFVSLTIV